MLRWTSQCEAFRNKVAIYDEPDVSRHCCIVGKMLICIKIIFCLRKIINGHKGLIVTMPRQILNSTFSLQFATKDTMDLLAWLACVENTNLLSVLTRAKPVIQVPPQLLKLPMVLISVVSDHSRFFLKIQFPVQI